MKDAPRDRGKQDLDVLIREAEMAVVESDRRWQSDVQALGMVLRGSTTKAAWVGGVGLGTLAAAWLMFRHTTRGRRRHVHSRPPHSRVRPAPTPLPRATGWSRLIELGGVLVGSALRAGLVPTHGKGGMSLLMSAGLPWLTRWWRSAAAGRAPSPARAPPAGRH